MTSQDEEPRERVEQSWDWWNGQIGVGNDTRVQRGNAPRFAQPVLCMTKAYTFPAIDQYLRERLMPVEGTIPNIVGIDMYGNSIPAGTVGGDLFEYINFQLRYDIAARTQRALRLSNEFLEPLPPGAPLRNSVDDHVQWLKARPDYCDEIEMEFRDAKSSEQVRVAEDLNDLYFTAGVLLVDAQGHGIISAKIASTVHDTFHALMLTELDRYGKTTLVQPRCPAGREADYGPQFARGMICRQQLI